MDRVEVYFTDLSPQKQAEILQLWGSNLNFDIFPMMILEPEEEAESV